uniref:Uncharacterized protein n=1 Tax=Timema cristinae TaxID=61476 RepID=A0A7R9DD74_TIMCR|nr:unnamed protein product [Timema cristinae]
MPNTPGLPLNDDKSLRSVCGSALEKIRFLTLNPSQFAEGPALSPLLTQSESFAVLMNISSGGARVPLPEGFSSWTQPRQEPDRFSNHPVLPLAPEPYRQGQKYYCMRKVSQKPAILNTSILDCSVTFTVDRNVCVFGVQAELANAHVVLSSTAKDGEIEVRISVPTQVPSQPLPENPELNSYPMTQAPQGTNSYTELLYAHLLDSDGSRLTYTHFTSRVAYSELIEISFNRPVFIQRNKGVSVTLFYHFVAALVSCNRQVVSVTLFYHFVAALVLYDRQGVSVTLFYHFMAALVSCNRQGVSVTLFYHFVAALVSCNRQGVSVTLFYHFVAALVSYDRQGVSVSLFYHLVAALVLYDRQGVSVTLFYHFVAALVSCNRQSVSVTLFYHFVAALVSCKRQGVSVTLFYHFVAALVSYDRQGVSVTLFYHFVAALVSCNRQVVYRVGVVLNKMGWYPMASCSQSVNCEPVFFSFCVGQPNESVRDGLIRSIGFSYI